MNIKYFLTLSCAILLSGCACNKKEWSLYTYQPTSNEAIMFVCDSLIKSENGNDEYAYAYKKANDLLLSKNVTKDNKCSVVKNSFNFDSRGPTASVDVKCEHQLTGEARDGLTWYKVIETEVIDNE